MNFLHGGMAMASRWPDGGAPGSTRHAPAHGMGVALLDGRMQLRAADARTLELLGATTVQEGRGIWADHLLGLMAPSPPARDRQPEGGRSELRLVLNGNGRALRIDLHRLGDGGHEDHVALIQDETLFDSIEQETRLAARLRGIFFFHRAVVHDLRGRLHNLALNIELLGNGPEGGPGTARDRADRLKRGLAQLSALLDGLFTHTAPAGEQVERFDLRTVVDEVQFLLEAQARQQHVTTRSQLPAGAVLVEGRRGELRQAYLGVLISALDGMPSGSELSVTVDSQLRGGCTLTVDTTLPAGGAGRIHPVEPAARAPHGDLRVVESILGSLGGQLLRRSGESTGTQITMVLPGVPPEPSRHQSGD